MRARLLLNLGLVLEQQKDTEQALDLIQQAALLCRKHNLYDDLHRTHVALAGLNERLGNCELALKHFDDAAKVDDIYLKADAQLLKAELLLKLGEWMEAQKLLYLLYKSKCLLDPVRQQVTKLLRIGTHYI
jgi:NF-kappa-B inhibitor-like protein 2